MKEATDQAVAQATSALDLDFQNKLALLKKDADSDARLAEQRLNPSPARRLVDSQPRRHGLGLPSQGFFERGGGHPNSEIGQVP